MLAETLDAYFVDYGEPGIWKGTVEVMLIYDNAYQLSGGLVDSTNPAVTVQSLDMPGIAQDDTLSVRGVAYTIQGIEPDATGALLTLQLERA